MQHDCYCDNDTVLCSECEVNLIFKQMERKLRQDIIITILVCLAILIGVGFFITTLAWVCYEWWALRF